MGLFNKIKSVLFEEEEIEVPVEETPVKKPKKQENNEKNLFERKRNVYEEEVKDEAPIVSDRDLFKVEKTFDFPVFDDQEFESLKSIKKDPVHEEPKKSMGINLFDYERPKVKREPLKDKAPEIKGRAYDTKKNDNLKFHPSPVISPVYGVLDKNYKKEDIVVANTEKKKIDVDDVRKRAFGTLEEDIEKNLLDKPRKIVEKKEEKKSISQEEKSIDELLEETAFDRIELEEDFNEPIETEPIELEVLDQQKEKTLEEKLDENDTLENDLFDLIDSMYEEKEEE